MIKIRYNVFETNSSSTHSLVYVGKGMQALKDVYPDKYEAVKDIIGVYYTKEEVKQSFLDIGATLSSKGTLDLTNVDPIHYDFGYRDETYYIDPAHKVLLVLAYLYEYEDWDPDNYFVEVTKEDLKEFGIKKIIYPKEGIDRVNHQCHDELLDEIRYRAKDFMFKKDIALLLDHD